MTDYKDLENAKFSEIRFETDKIAHLIGEREFTFRYDSFSIEDDKIIVKSDNTRCYFKLDEDRTIWKCYQVENEATRVIDWLRSKPCKLRIANGKAYLTDINYDSNGIIIDIVDIQQNLRDGTMIVTDLKSISIDLTVRTFYSPKWNRIVTEIEDVQYKWADRE